LAAFIKWDGRNPCCFQMFQKYISRIKPESPDRVFVEIIRIVIREGLEDVKSVSQDAIVVKAFFILYLVSSGRDLTTEELSGLIELRKETCWTFGNKIKEMIAKTKRFENPNEGWKELILISRNLKKRDQK